MRVTASELLDAAGLEPGRVRAALPRIDPGRIPVRKAAAWFRFFWASGITALAMPWAIYVDPARLGGPPRDLGVLVAHELAHIEQWRRLGAMRWAQSYLGDYFRGRRSGMDHGDAYRNVGLEVEARGLARDITGP